MPTLSESGIPGLAGFELDGFHGLFAPVGVPAGIINALNREVLKVMTRELKKRREAATAYAEAGHPDRASSELAEAAVIEAYLPAQLADDELVALVASAIAESGAVGPQAMGKVMKVVAPTVAGRADGGRVAAEVKRQLIS